MNQLDYYFKLYDELKNNRKFNKQLLIYIIVWVLISIVFNNIFDLHFLFDIIIIFIPILFSIIFIIISIIKEYKMYKTYPYFYKWYNKDHKFVLELYDVVNNTNQKDRDDIFIKNEIMERIKYILSEYDDIKISSNILYNLINDIEYDMKNKILFYEKYNKFKKDLKI